MDTVQPSGPRSRSLGLIAAVTAIVALGALTVAAAPDNRDTVVAAAPATAASAAPVELSGALADSDELTSADLEAFTDRSLDVTYLSGQGEQKHSYTGPLLYDVLMAAEPRFDAATKNDSLRFAVLVRAEDGYEAVVAWGELDPELANTEVLLAHTEDGEALEPLRLVMPSDSHGGRYVSDVAEIVVLRLSPDLAEGPAGNPAAASEPGAPPVGHG